MFGAIAECDAIEIKASGDFLRGVVLIETSADGVVFHRRPLRYASYRRSG